MSAPRRSPCGRAVGGIAIGLGPVLGGLLVDHIGWESVFWLHLPVVATILIGLSIVPESRDSRRTPMDVPGAILVTSGLLTVVYGIIQGPESGWTSAEIISFFALGGVLLAAFGIVEARSPHPMLPVRYLKQRDFIGPALVVTVLMIAMSGIFFLHHAIPTAGTGKKRADGGSRHRSRCCYDDAGLWNRGEGRPVTRPQGLSRSWVA